MTRANLPMLTAVLAVLSGVAAAAELLRMSRTGNPTYSFMLWNLFLAWIPYLLALAAYACARGRAARSAVGALGLGWLLFLPNAPYMVTDLIHLGSSGDAPFWFDTAMFASFALAGLALGFGSLYVVQLVVAGLAGARRSWALAFGSLALASFGIYLGRVEQWNSWDFLVRPGRLLTSTAERLSQPPHGAHALAGTLALALLLSGSYFVLYELLDRRLRQRARSR